MLDFGDVVKIEDVYKLSGKIVEVVTQGQFPRLDTSILHHIQRFYSYDARDISRLHVVCRRFRLVFQTDEVWRNITVDHQWLGAGSEGSDEEIWNRYRRENGLPYFNAER
jgi:F-box-like